MLLAIDGMGWLVETLIPWIDMRYTPLLSLLTVLACVEDNTLDSTVDSVDSAIEPVCL